MEHKACNVKLNCKMVLLSEGVVMHSALLIECLNLYKNAPYQTGKATRYIE